MISSVAADDPVPRSAGTLAGEPESGGGDTARSPQESPSRYALFWSEGSTWIVDTQAGVLFRAPTLLALGPDGNIFEYRLKVNSTRLPSKDRPYGHIYRWVSLDRYLIGGQHVDQLTNHFTVDELKRDTHDEHQILQFTGEFITLIRWFYHEATPEDLSKSTSLYTLSLSGVQPLPELRKAPQLLQFTRSLYPRLIPECLNAEPRMVRWELGGQRPVFWLTLSPVIGEPCEASLSALRINPTPRHKQGRLLSWTGETLYLERDALYGGVVDALIHPTQAVAITLEGAQRRDETLFVPQLSQLYERPVTRYLSVWRGYEEAQEERGRHISFPEGVQLRRLDGARWIPDDHPLISMLTTHFLPVQQKSCFKPLIVKRQRQYARGARPTLHGHLCAIEAQGRVWEGQDDLSAGVRAQEVNDWLYLDVWVTDPDRASGDMLRIWTGNPSAPIELKVTPKGVIGREAIKAGVKYTWLKQPAKKRDRKSDGDTGRQGGYLVRLQLPMSLVQDHLSLAVDDEDPSLKGLSQRLWVAGAPKADGLSSSSPSPMRIERR